MNAVAGAGSGKEWVTGRWPWVAWLALASGVHAHASEIQAEEAPVTVAEAHVPPPALVVTRESRSDALHAADAAAGVGASWFPAQGSSLGLMAILHPSSAGPDGQPGRRQGLDLGLHWRSSGGRHLGVQAWHSLGPVPDAWTLVQSRQPSYGARVEMRLPPARFGGLVADYRFLGLQLQSGARITLKRKNGRPTLYYRVQFYAL